MKASGQDDAKKPTVSRIPGSSAGMTSSSKAEAGEETLTTKKVNHAEREKGKEAKKA